jgi:hypothetical protein
MGKAGNIYKKMGKSRESLGTIWENLINMWKRYMGSLIDGLLHVMGKYECWLMANVA